MLLSDKFISSKQLSKAPRTNTTEQNIARERMLKRMEQELAMVAPSVEETVLPEIQKPSRPLSFYARTNLQHNEGENTTGS